MSLAKRTLDWTEKKFDEIDENTKHPLLKAGTLGVIEGIIDGAIIAYPFLLAGLWAANRKLSKYEK